MYRQLLSLIMLGGVGLVFSTPPNASATTITVTTAEDELNTDGDCSLREAVEAANINVAVDACVAGSDVATDTITLANGSTYTIGIVGASEPANATGDFDISNNTVALDIAFEVSAGGDATVNANDMDRAFEAPTGASMSFSDITILDGRPGGTETGGGILLTTGALTLTNMTFTSNQSVTSWGAVGLAGTHPINQRFHLTHPHDLYTINCAYLRRAGLIHFVEAGARIGQAVVVGDNVVIEAGVVVGDNVQISHSLLLNGAAIPAGTNIRNKLICGDTTQTILDIWADEKTL